MQELPRTIAVSVLGTTSLHRDGVEVPLPAAKMRALLALRHALDPDRAARTPLGVLVTTGTHYRLALPPSAVDASSPPPRTPPPSSPSLPTPGFRYSTASCVPRRTRSSRACGSCCTPGAASRTPTSATCPRRPPSGPASRSCAPPPLESGLTLGLALGTVPISLAGLARVCAERPYNERLAGLRALALARAARQGEALGVLTALRARLIDELGIEPVSALGDVYLAILRSDPAVHLHQLGRVDPPAAARPRDGWHAPQRPHSEERGGWDAGALRL